MVIMMAEPTNYRPVSLTSTICKTIITNKMTTHMQNNLFTNKQSGFLPGRSTVYQLKLLDKWIEEWNKGNDIDEIYCNFAKAFNTVPHRRLLKSLRLMV